MITAYPGDYRSGLLDGVRIHFLYVFTANGRAIAIGGETGINNRRTPTP